MKKKIISMLICVSMICSLTATSAPVSVSAETAVQETNGNVDLTISTASELLSFAAQVNAGNDFSGKTIVLADNIDLQGSANSQWTPIGNSNKKFSGTFDGQGHTIQGLYINNTDDDTYYQGLFGRIENATIKNLTVIGEVTSASEYTGGIVGYASGGTITDCENKVIVSGTESIGGIAGHANGSITECTNSAAITGTTFTGGIVGSVYGEIITITNCTNSAAIIGEKHTGGIVGGRDYYDYSILETIIECTNSGTITGIQDTGGIVGRDCSTTKSTNSGKVNGVNYVGGILGNGYRHHVGYCTNTAKVTAKATDSVAANSDQYVGGIVGDGGSVYDSINTGDVYGQNNYIGGIGIATIKRCVNTGFIESQTGNAYPIYGGSSSSDYANAGKYNNYYVQSCVSTNGTDTSLDGYGDDIFASGRVTWELQNAKNNATDEDDCGLVVWGQTLEGDSKDTYPQITSDEAKEVHRLKFSYRQKTSSGTAENIDYSKQYLNDNGTFTMPKNPTVQNYQFSHWSDVNYESADVFDSENAQITKDTEIYAVFNREFTTSKEPVVEVTYGEAMSTVNVSTYLQFSSGSATDAFEIELADGSTLPDGLSFKNGRITGTPTVYKGDYPVTFDVVDTTPTLLSVDDGGLDPETATKNAQLTLIIRVSDIEPVEMFTSGGTGTQEDPFLITSAEDISKISEYVKRTNTCKGLYFDLTNDIDLSTMESEWEPIGNSRDVYFDGTFNGNGYTVKGLVINDEEKDYCGLFGCNKGTIKNLSVDGTIIGNNYVGGIVGLSPSGVGIIENCISNVSITGNNYVGGIVGYVQMDGFVTNCYSTKVVKGNMYAGGIIGFKFNAGMEYIGRIENCYYLENTAAVGIGGEGAGTELPEETLTADIEGAAEKTSADTFASGIITFKLQGDNEEQIWGQALGIETADAMPLLTNDKKKKVYKVDFNANNDTEVKTIYVNTNTQITELPEKTGYTFVSWFDTELLEGDAIEAVGTENLSLWAKWKANSYNVTLNGNGVEIPPYEDVTSYTYAKGAILPSNLTRDGYTFAGWYESETFEGEPVISISKTDLGDKTFYAKWDLNVYKITLNSNDGIIADGENVTEYTYTKGAVLPAAVTKEGYTFGGWYDNEDFTGDAVTSVSETDLGDKTFYAKWTANVYTVTLNTNDGVIADGENVTEYTYSKGATLPVNVTKDGYTFDGWYTSETFEGDAVTAISETDMGDKVFYAKWTAVQQPTIAPTTPPTETDKPSETDKPTETDKPSNTDEPAETQKPLKQFTITFVNFDGTELAEVKTTEGSIPVYSGTTPVKESDDTYNYVFAGWDTTLLPASDDVVYTAVFTAIEKTAEKQYAETLEIFDDKLTIEKIENTNGTTTYIISPTGENELPAMTLYTAVYDQNGTMTDIFVTNGSKDALGNITVVLAKPETKENETVKFMLWTDKFIPVMMALTNK